jgi:hypothetical protein
VAEDRNLLERAQDYLVSGDFDRDARYVLGPHLSEGLLGLAQLIGPGADIKAGMDEVERIIPSLREGNVPGALAATGLAAATPLFMVSPATKVAREVSEELIPQRLFHGTSNPDIKKFKFSKEGVLGEGVYLTPDPKYASTYATGDTANVIPVTADIKNPLVVQATNVEPSTDVLKALGVSPDKAAKITEKAFDDKGNITKEISTRARKQGYDAVILKNKDGNVQEIVSYKPDNISSAIGKKAEEAAPENISVFPKPERMFPEGQRPKGGEYLNPKTEEVLTNKNVESASISITPEGKPKFDASPVEKEVVGSPTTKGATQIKTNLFKKSAGWKWVDGPVEYKDIPTLVSVQNKGKHYYTLEANFPEGVNLTRYADAPSEPRLRPTVKGFVDLGKQIGTISVRGKEHPVYDRIVNRYAGGSIVERNPNNYSPKAI